jgi:hypothetical protein
VNGLYPLLAVRPVVLIVLLLLAGILPLLLAGSRILPRVSVLLTVLALARILTRILALLFSLLIFCIL